MSVLFWVVFIVVLAFGFVVFFGAPYVPSRKKYIREVFKDLYQLGPGDTLLDLGAGDGVVLREAARCGALAIGYELNPLLVWIGRLLSHKYSKVQLRIANIWRTPFPDSTTVVYLFGDARDIKRLARRIEEEASRLNRMLYIISYGFELPGHKNAGQQGAYYLYKIKPLHVKKPQV
ncbi:MAG TPA: class I SAM-dependent methyltransferase [Candidatus Saccharimonadales bacterium]